MVAVVVATAVAEVAAEDEEAVDMAEDIMDVVVVTRMEEEDITATIITMVGTGIIMTGK